MLSQKKRFDNASRSIFVFSLSVFILFLASSMRSLPVERHRWTFNTYHTILCSKKQFFLFSFFALCYNSVISLSFTLISFDRIFCVYKKICFKEDMYKPQLPSAVRRFPMKTVVLLYPTSCIYEIVILNYFLHFAGKEVLFVSPDGTPITAMEVIQSMFPVNWPILLRMK